MLTYAASKQKMVLYSIVAASAAALLLWLCSPYAAVALLVGTTCGLLNALLSMRANERLLDHRSVSSFVTTAVLRIGVFGTLPVEFSLHGPWWTMCIYFLGFFLPLSLYAGTVDRTPLPPEGGAP